MPSRTRASQPRQPWLTIQMVRHIPAESTIPFHTVSYRFLPFHTAPPTGPRSRGPTPKYLRGGCAVSVFLFTMFRKLI